MKYLPDYTRFLAHVQKTTSAPLLNGHHREPTRLHPQDNPTIVPNTRDHKPNTNASNPPTSRRTHNHALTNHGNHPEQTVHNSNNHTTSTNNDHQTTTPVIQTTTTNTTTTTTVTILNIARTYNIYPAYRMHTHLTNNIHQLELLLPRGLQCSHLHNQPPA